MCVDLHLHSTFSDGTATPGQLVSLARRHELTAISLTDHDTVDGINAITARAAEVDLTVIPGIELNTIHGPHNLHILGYGFDVGNRRFASWLTRIQAGRQERNREILRRLQKLGIAISLTELAAASGGGQIGRPHFARLLVDKGIVDSTGEAFNRYLRKGAAAWVDRFAYSAAESIDMIHRIGGIAVLAHPGQLDPGFTFLPLLIYQLVERGLDGLEVYYPSHSATMQKRLLRLANTYKLVVTGGSDYHGNNRGFVSMAGARQGFCPPDSLLNQIRERINARHQQ